VTLLDEPAVVVDLEPEVEPPAPKGVLARAVPVLVVFALLGLIGGAGTFAAFTASTDNPATFATGSLVLSNTNPTVTGCLSINGTNNENDACGELIGVELQQPGDEAEAELTLENVGSLAASVLKVHGDGTCASGTVGDFSGSVSLCERLLLSIQEYDDDTFTTETACLFGGAAGDVCDHSDPDATVDEFFTEYPAWNDALEMGAMDTTGPTKFRYLKVGLRLEGGNEVQGRDAVFSLTWRIEQ